MPPAPFDFKVSHTDFQIIFTNYGNPISRTDANLCIQKALHEIEHEIYIHWTAIDVPIGMDLAFTYGPAELKVNTAPLMYRTYCLMLLVGVLEWGQKYDFIEVDMEFVQRKGSMRRLLGTGSLRLNSAAS